MSKTTGTLEFNFVTGRPAMFDSLGGHVDDFHCGNTLEIRLDGQWITCRAELGWGADGRNYWYLCNNQGWSRRLSEIDLPAPIRVGR